MAVNMWCMGMISQPTQMEEIVMEVSRRPADFLYVNDQRELVQQV
jgi:hypothetical protein